MHCYSLYCIALLQFVLYCTVTVCTVLHCYSLYCIALLQFVLYCTVTVCTLLHCYSFPIPVPISNLMMATFVQRKHGASFTWVMNWCVDCNNNWNCVYCALCCWYSVSLNITCISTTWCLCVYIHVCQSHYHILQHCWRSCSADNSLQQFFSRVHFVWVPSVDKMLWIILYGCQNQSNGTIPSTHVCRFKMLIVLDTVQTHSFSV